jgi:hypothetical protein
MRHWLRRGACFLFIFCKVRSRSALFVKRVLVELKKAAWFAEEAAAASRPTTAQG